MPASSTFATVLEGLLVRSPGDPLVTFYDDDSGERVELSVATYANWVAKTGSLLQDELGVERGATVVLDLPTHWLGPVWLGALWSLGIAASDTGSLATRADLVVCGPDRVETHAGGPLDVVACSLLPMGVRFRTSLPPGVIDFGEVVWSQPDRLLVLDPATADDVAWSDGHGDLDQASLLSTPGLPGGRLTTTVPATGREGLGRFVGPLLAGRGTVWVAGSPSGERLAELARAERAELDER